MTTENLGLVKIPDFITLDEEVALLNNIQLSSEAKSCKTRNTIKRFGSSKPYNSHIASKEIPDYFKPIVERIVSQNLVKEKIDSITINEYLIGQSISPHIDTPASGKIITILSLLGDATMNFNFKKEKFSIEFPARCLLQMKDDLRNKWQHSIDPVKTTRISIVFRCST